MTREDALQSLAVLCAHVALALALALDLTKSLQLLAEGFFENALLMACSACQMGEETPFSLTE